MIKWDMPYNATSMTASTPRLIRNPSATFTLFSFMLQKIPGDFDSSDQARLDRYVYGRIRTYAADLSPIPFPVFSKSCQLSCHHADQLIGNVLCAYSVRV